MVINSMIGIQKTMESDADRIEFALRQAIEKCPGYVNPRQFLSVYHLDDNTRDSIITKVSMSQNIVTASGMLRYLEIDKDMLIELVGMMDLDSETIDLSRVYRDNTDSISKLGIRGPQEVRCVIEKYNKLTPTAISTKVRTSEVVQALKNAGIGNECVSRKNDDVSSVLPEEIAESAEISMDDAILGALDSEYKSLEKILGEAKEKYHGPIHPASIAGLLSRTPGVVLKAPATYRQVNITRDDLIVILKEAGSIIGFVQVSSAIVFDRTSTSCYDKDIRSHEELMQLILQYIPEMNNNINSRLDLSNPLIYDGTSERKVHLKNEIKPERRKTTTLNANNSDDYSEIRKKIIEVLSARKPMNFSQIRRVLITEYSPQEMRDELESMYNDRLLFKKQDSVYRLHAAFTADAIDDVLSIYRDCVISISRIYSELFLELKEMDVLSPSELSAVIEICARARIIDSR